MGMDFQVGPPALLECLRHATVAWEGWRSTSASRAKHVAALRPAVLPACPCLLSHRSTCFWRQLAWDSAVSLRTGTAL